MKKILGIALSAVMAFNLTINVVQSETIVYDQKEVEYTNTNIGIRIDGALVDYEGMYPVVLNNRTLVPVREIMESQNINATVEWVAAEKKVVITKGDKTVSLKVGESKGYINGYELVLDSEAKLIKDKSVGTYKMMVPIRFITESFGYDVRWDKDLQEVVLTNVEEARKAFQIEDSNVSTLVSSSIIKDLPTELKSKPIHIQAVEEQSFHDLKDGVISGDQKNASINDIVSNFLESNFNIIANGPMSKVDYTVTDEKLILDIDGLVMDDFPTVIRMDNGVHVSAIRTSQSDYSPYKARIVFDLYDRSIPKEIKLSDDRYALQVTFNDIGLDNIDISQDSIGDVITLEGDYTDYTSFRLSEPNALVFDLNNCVNLLGDKNILDISGQTLNHIYVGSINHKTTRLVVHTEGHSNYQLNYDEINDKTTIRFTPLEFSQITFNYDSYPMISIPKTSSMIGFDINSIGVSQSSLGFVTKLSFNQAVAELNLNQKFYIGDQYTDNIDIYTYEGNTSIVFNNRHILEYKITEDNKYIYIQGIRPKELYDTMVLIDAGHGGYQPGAVYNGLLEKDINLKLMNYIRQYTESRETIKYFYTRIDDTASSLPDRIEIANDLDVDLLVSMHNNAIDIGKNPLLTAVRGMEILTTIDTETSIKEVKLANDIFATMKNELPELELRAIKDYNKLYLLRYSHMPAIIIEYGYLTNPEDVANLKQEWILEKAAEITEKTIFNYFSK